MVMRKEALDSDRPIYHIFQPYYVWNGSLALPKLVVFKNVHNCAWSQGFMGLVDSQHKRSNQSKTHKVILQHLTQDSAESELSTWVLKGKGY